LGDPKALEMEWILIKIIYFDFESQRLLLLFIVPSKIFLKLYIYEYIFLMAYRLPLYKQSSLEGPKALESI